MSVSSLGSSRNFFGGQVQVSSLAASGISDDLIDMMSGDRGTHWKKPS